MEDKTIRLDEINLHGLASLLIRNLWIVVAVCISAILCYTSLSRLTYEPTYTSSATFMVSAKDSTSAYNSLTTTQSMASVFVEVFQSNLLTISPLSQPIFTTIHPYPFRIKAKIINLFLFRRYCK